VEQVALARAVAAGVADVPGADVFMPTMSASALAELGEFGHERVVARGDVLYHAGDESHDLFVVLEGVVEGAAEVGRPFLPPRPRRTLFRAVVGRQEVRHGHRGG
jgi:hypothetical protein